MSIALMDTLIVIPARKDFAYSLVVVWALADITVKQSTHPNILAVAEVAIAVILVASALSIAVGRWRHKRA
jgi:hypothetical protein